MIVEFRRLALLSSLLTAAFISTGCGKPDTGPTDGGGGGGSDSCLEDSDCPDEALFYCDQVDSVCKPSCKTREECGAARRGEYALDYCAGSLGCQCDEGTCVASLCSADVDCGPTGTCRNGACISAPPAASEVTSCQITPDFVVTSQGAKVKFWVSTWKGTEPVVLKDGITWTAAAPLTGTGTGLSATFDVNASNTAAAEALAVSVGGVTCKAKVLAHGAVAAGQVRVSVTDELTGRPVSGAVVMLSDTGTGAAINTSAATDASGTVSVPLGNNPPANVNINVFHNDFNYLTIAGYAHGTGTRDISAVIRRHATFKYGGYKGTFNNVPTSPNIKAGIAAMSIAGSVTDLSITQILGPTEKTAVQIGTIVNEPDVPLPGGAFLQYDTNKIKPNVSAQGLAGVCYTNGVPDEADILAGKCGTRTAWALAGDIPLSEISGAASEITGGVSNINYGSLLSKILPVFRRFNSSVVRDVRYTLIDTPNASTGDPNFTNRDHFVTANHDFQQIPLGFNFVVQHPELPKFKNTYVDGLILLGGTNVPGRGVVPLGMGIGVNSNPVDGLTDKQGTLSAAGLITMRMAPTHHGLEGTQYGILALAASLKSATDSTAGLATSAIFERVPGNKLAFDPAGNSKVQLTGPFPTIPEGAVYNFTNAVQGPVQPRTFRFGTAPTLTGMSVIRVQFTDRAERRWVVYVDPGTPTFRLPAPPSTFVDRTFYTGATTGERSTMLVQTLKLADDAGAAISFKGLVEQNATNADRLIDFTRAFTVYDYSRPKVEWVTPASGATTYAAPLKVKVTHFKIGPSTDTTADGKVRVDCGNGAFVYGETADASGKGEVTISALPAGCSPASNKTLTATLVNAANAPIDPPVSAAITIP